jgi:ATP-dependent DNA helicase HFM1/MER3
MQCLAVQDCLPKPYSDVFKFTHFNAIQSMVLTQVLSSSDNMVIGAPTGSGKTAVHELAILKLLIDNRTSQKQMKCVYVAPNKALCQQHCAEWTDTFGKLGQM